MLKMCEIYNVKCLQPRINITHEELFTCDIHVTRNVLFVKQIQSGGSVVKSRIRSVTLFKTHRKCYLGGGVCVCVNEVIYKLQAQDEEQHRHN